MTSQPRPAAALGALALCVALSPLASAPARAAAPHVVVSIKPIHSLVAGVMAGIGEPGMLMQGQGSSEHTYTMRPSDARALNQADLVFWVGPGLETFLIKPLEALSADARVIGLAGAPGLRLLPAREGGMWDEHLHAHAEEHHGAAAAEHHGEGADEVEHHQGHHDGSGPFDMHVWLDPHNARAIVATVAAALAEADPEHAAAYARNAERVRAELEQLDRRLAQRLAPVRERPFIVFHDAYHYFEERYGLHAAGSITVSPERRPGAQRLQRIRQRLAELDAACVFAEPQFEPSLVATLVEGTDARTGVLDPLGAALEAGPGQYVQLMDELASALVQCLEPRA